MSLSDQGLVWRSPNDAANARTELRARTWSRHVTGTAVDSGPHFGHPRPPVWYWCWAAVARVSWPSGEWPSIWWRIVGASVCVCVCMWRRAVNCRRLCSVYTQTDSHRHRAPPSHIATGSLSSLRSITRRIHTVLLPYAARQHVYIGKYLGTVILFINTHVRNTITQMYTLSQKVGHPPNRGRNMVKS